MNGGSSTFSILNLYFEAKNGHRNCR